MSARFRRHFGAGPVHAVGYLGVIGVSGYFLSIMFQEQFAPEPLNLALWLLGGAVLHDAVFLPAYGVANTLVSRFLRAGNGDSLVDATLGPPPVGVHVEPPITTADSQRRVPVLNYLRVPFVVSAVLFLVFLPRILDRQPQNFINALGHPPPDFLARWLLVTALVFVASAVLYAVRWVRAGRGVAKASAPSA